MNVQQATDERLELFYQVVEGKQKMNERIKQRALQAGFDVNGWNENAMKKFAELIVKEFETVAKQQPWYYDAPSCGWRAPINHVCDVVKEHFGVEE